MVNYTLVHCTLILYLSGNKWDTIYSGAAREHLCDRLNPGCSYRLRVYCIGEGGQSMVILAYVFFNTSLEENVIQPLINIVRGIIVQKCLTESPSEPQRTSIVAVFQVSAHFYKKYIQIFSSDGVFCFKRFYLLTEKNAMTFPVQHVSKMKMTFPKSERKTSDSM